MSVSYSFSTNESLSSKFPNHSSCLRSTISDHIYIILTVPNILLLLPLSVYVLILGFQRWEQQRSSAAVMSFSDFFTYNMAVMELIGVLGYGVCVFSTIAHYHDMAWFGYMTAVFPWPGQIYFPILTCVDRYLAVVHPITYMRLRQAGGVCIRNISTGAIWLQCFAMVGLLLLLHDNSSYIYKYTYHIQISVAMAFSLIVVAFSSLSILCILTRPRPGETAGNRARVDQSKQRAFHTIIIIMVVLLFRFGGNLVCNVLIISPTVSLSVKCVVISATLLFDVPSSLVLPLLFLHRAGKLPGCRH